MRLIARVMQARIRASRTVPLASEQGFAIVVALGVLTVVSLLIAAAFVAANGDIHNAQHDLEGKRAYYSARAGLNTFLYRLNKNTEFWEQCPSQAKTNLPGSTTTSYSYASLPANGAGACSTTDPVHTMINLSDGSFRMQFTGYSGTGTNEVRRTLVASFKRASPLDFLWYSVYETLDPNTYSNPANFQDCAALLRNGRPSHCVTISWITGDNVKGPMYTQDQYAICGSPVFGRPGGTDSISTPAASNALYPSFTGCQQNATINGSLVLNAPYITPPPDNTALLTYAQTDGKVYNGTTSIVMNGNTASVTNNGTTTTVDLVTNPIIYVTNGTCTTPYSPYNVTYPTTGGCGNVYVKGTYSTSVTIAAANDIIVNGNVTTNLAGTAVAGFVANNFIRVMHGVTARSGATQGSCGSAANIASETFPALRIDAAVLALKHSFIVDNYDCGAPISGNLTVNGAIAQLFRGTVGTTSGGTSQTGYLKNYSYDDRLAVQQPPFLFDLASSSWRVVRETSCVAGSTDATVAC